MQRTKVFLGALVILGTLGFLVFEQLSGASFDARINARISVVRAPISGFLTLSLGAIGEPLYAAETVGIVQNPYADETRVAQLRESLVSLRAELSRAEGNAKYLELEINRLAVSIETFSRLRKTQLEALRAATEAELAKARREASHLAKQLSRSTELAQKGVARVADFDQITAEHDRARIETARLESVLASAKVRLDGADLGQFLGSDAEGGSYQSVVQRLDDLRLRYDETTENVVALQKRKAETEKRLEDEQLHYDISRRATIASPVSGISWRISAGSGEFVTAGAEVMEVADCANLFVTLTVTKSTYNLLRRGDPVRFALNTEDMVFDGRIIRLAGSNAEQVYTGLAVGPGEDQLKRYDVAIEVPGLMTDMEGRCEIGRTGRVYFTNLAKRWIPEIFR